MDKPPWTTRSILALFTPQMLQQAAEAFWDDPDFPADLRSKTVSSLAQVMRFRPVAFKKMPRVKKVHYLLKYLDHETLEVLRRHMLISHHAVHQQRLMDDFRSLWALGGRQEEGNSGTPPPHPDLVASSLERLRSQYAPLDIAVYFASASLSNGWGEALWPYVEELLAAHSSGQGVETVAARGWDLEEQTLFEEVVEFGPVDRLLFQQILATFSQEEGALSRAQLAELVNALVQLNPDRSASYFHRGFLQGLLPQEKEEQEVEGKPAQHLWSLAGQLLGLARQRAWAEVVAWGEVHPEFLKELLQLEAGCAPLCGACLFWGFWTLGRKAEAVQLLSPGLLALMRGDFIPSLVNFTENQLRAHAPQEAHLLLDQLLQAWADLKGRDFPPDFLSRLTHRRAQCLCGEQRFAESKALLEELLQDKYVSPAEVHLDLGLVEGGFAWLSEVVVPDHPEAVAAMRERLKKGRPHFEQALKNPRSPTAQYALGVLELLEGQYPEAAKRLEESYRRAAEQPEPYRAALLFAKMRLYYGLALLCALDEPRLSQALELLQATDQVYPAEEWPRWLLEEAAQIIDLTETAEGLQLLEWLHQRVPQTIEIHLADPELLHRSPALRQALDRRATQSRHRDLPSVWQDHTTLVAVHLKNQDLEAASQVLDRLEALALDQPALRECFVAFLDQPEHYQPAWDEEDALHSAALVFEIAGQLDQAYIYLRTLFFRYRGQGHGERAAGLLERIRGYHLPEALTEEVLRQAPALAVEAVNEPDSIRTQVHEHLRQGHPLRLLVVGGNELQASFDQDLQTYFQTEFPGLEIAFEHTPRTSSWDKHYDRIKGRLEHYDGLVLLRFLRTHLGRSLRALAGQLGKPWFPCTGSGKAFLQRTILHAAQTLATSDR